MRRWRVTVSYETTVGAEDEEDAVLAADAIFNFLSEAEAEEIQADDESAEETG